MKAAIKLTIDGLVRALRWQAHDLAEDAERGYRVATRISHAAQDKRGAGSREMGGSDDRTGS